MRWATTLTAAGWMFAFAYLALVTAQLRQAFAIEASSFDDGLWGARVERVSFVALPQNVLLLVAAAAAGAVATLLCRDLADRTHMWLAQLVRAVAGICYVVVAIAALRILVLLTHHPDAVGDFGAILSQLAGILTALAASRICLETERST